MVKPRKAINNLAFRANVGSWLLSSNVPGAKLLGRVVSTSVLRKVTGRKRIGGRVAQAVKNPLAVQTLRLFSRARSESDRVFFEGLASNPSSKGFLDFNARLLSEIRHSKNPEVRKVFLVERGSRGINGKIVIRFFQTALTKVQKEARAGKPKAELTTEFTRSRLKFSEKLAAQNALDLSGISSRSVREAVYSIVEKIGNRARERVNYGVRVDLSDPQTTALVTSLLSQFNSEKESAKFLGNYMRNIELIDGQMSLMKEVLAEHFSKKAKEV